MSKHIVIVIVAMLIMLCAGSYTYEHQGASATTIRAAERRSLDAIPLAATFVQTKTIILEGTSASMNTRIMAHTGDIIKITATGIINNGGSGPNTRPDGLKLPNTLFGPSILPSLAATSLIGSIDNIFSGDHLLDDGADTNSTNETGSSLGYPGLYGPGFIGEDFTATMSSSGLIYLAVNDYPLDDNIGSFVVTITITSAQPPEYKNYLPVVYN